MAQGDNHEVLRQASIQLLQYSSDREAHLLQAIQWPEEIRSADLGPGGLSQICSCERTAELLIQKMPLA